MSEKNKTVIPDDIDMTASNIVRADYSDASEIDYALYLAIARAILAERERSQWQPVKDAPKDRMVLVCDVNWPAALQRDTPPPIKVGYLDASTGAWKIFGASWHPTHFMPLPSPPTKEGE